MLQKNQIFNFHGAGFELSSADELDEEIELEVSDESLSELSESVSDWTAEEASIVFGVWRALGAADGNKIGFKVEGIICGGTRNDNDLSRDENGMET